MIEFYTWNSLLFIYPLYYYIIHFLHILFISYYHITNMEYFYIKKKLIKFELYNIINNIYKLSIKYIFTINNQI